MRRADDAGAPIKTLEGIDASVVCLENVNKLK